MAYLYYANSSSCVPDFGTLRNLYYTKPFLSKGAKERKRSRLYYSEQWLRIHNLGSALALSPLMIRLAHSTWWRFLGGRQKDESLPACGLTALGVIYMPHLQFIDATITDSRTLLPWVLSGTLRLEEELALMYLSNGSREELDEGNN
ncbi:uncharacterized protein FRV6_01058 [Fusarium oxysporum]|uniref:Uncharacterized protein n=1 Tax=Fusarium oxysporum TaxID=5507 RepID=A0A2H3SK88_FUSOX|nr:uncharacterized protein FRV6_01058 [Fusarium oxysporum]